MSDRLRAPCEAQEQVQDHGRDAAMMQAVMKVPQEQTETTRIASSLGSPWTL